MCTRIYHKICSDYHTKFSLSLVNSGIYKLIILDIISALERAFHRHSSLFDGIYICVNIYNIAQELIWHSIKCVTDTDIITLICNVKNM